MEWHPADLPAARAVTQEADIGCRSHVVLVSSHYVYCNSLETLLIIYCVWTRSYTPRIILCDAQKSWNRNINLRIKVNVFNCKSRDPNE